MKAVSLTLIIAFLLSSCTEQKTRKVITWQVTRSDYKESISIQGTVQAVVSFPVIPPRSMFGQMTIVRLAADGAFVKTGDTICVLTVPELESRYLASLSSVERMEAELKKTEADNKLNIALLEAQLATSRAQLKIS
jgi:multidrug efflux pump subunit AcrA (membrane-fusion protein)